MDQYVLEGKTPVRVDFYEFIKWTDEQHEARPSHKHVDSTTKDGVRVSTIFMGLDHSWGGGVPVLFETMIFGGEHDGYQERCSTWAQAEAMHKAACERAFGSSDAAHDESNSTQSNKGD